MTAETDIIVEENIDPPENQEIVSKAFNPCFQSPDFQTKHSEKTEKSTVRFKDIPEENGSQIGRASCRERV